MKVVLLISYSSMKTKFGMIRRIFDIENWLWKSEFCYLLGQIHNKVLICQIPFKVRMCYFAFNYPRAWCGSCWKILEWYLLSKIWPWKFTKPSLNDLVLCQLIIMIWIVVFVTLQDIQAWYFKRMERKEDVWILFFNWIFLILRDGLFEKYGNDISTSRIFEMFHFFHFTWL